MENKSKKLHIKDILKYSKGIVKNEKLNLEYRMYGLVNYQLGGTIHAGIQYGHSVVEYSLIHGKDKEYKKWANIDKTFIILNGGTTNDSTKNYGTLQKNRDLLIENEIKIAQFREPDLNDSLTSVVFLVDERVFNKEKYPDFNYVSSHRPLDNIVGFSTDRANTISNDERYYYKIWLKSIGGEQNAFLRNFLPKFKLA